LTTVDWSDARLYAVAAVAILAGFVRGFSGFGAGMVFIPAASAIYDPIVAIVLLFLIDTAASAPILPPHFRNCRWREVGPMAAAASLAFPFGLLFLLSVDPVATRWVLSGFILIATAAMASGLRYKGEPRIGQTFAVGLAMGFLSGAIGLGGPLIVLFWLGGPERAARVRSNIFAFFGAFSIVSLVGYWWSGLFTAPRLIGALALLPLYAGDGARVTALRPLDRRELPPRSARALRRDRARDDAVLASVTERLCRPGFRLRHLASHECVRRQRLETLEIARLCGRDRPWRESGVERIGQGIGPAEELERFVAREARQAGRLVERREPVGPLERSRQHGGGLGRQPEAQVDGARQARLDVLIGLPDDRLERRDHVTEDVFGGVVEKERQPGGRREVRPQIGADRLHQQRMLRHRKDVVADRLPVPARDAREAVRDVLDLDVERGGIEEVEPPPRQHALPGAGPPRGHGRTSLPPEGRADSGAARAG